MSDRPDEFHPNSIDATLSRILANQDEARRTAEATLVQVIKTNGRVTQLETWRDVVTARVIFIASLSGGLASAAAWAIGLYLGKN
jgi:hypothetical protein